MLQSYFLFEGVTQLECTGQLCREAPRRPHLACSNSVSGVTSPNTACYMALDVMSSFVPVLVILCGNFFPRAGCQVCHDTLDASMVYATMVLAVALSYFHVG